MQKTEVLTFHCPQISNKMQKTYNMLKDIRKSLSLQQQLMVVIVPRETGQIDSVIKLVTAAALKYII